MNPLLLEIDRLDAEDLRIIAEATERMRKRAAERTSILTAGKKMSSAALKFDGNIVRWDGGEVELTDNGIAIVKALWFAKKHRIDTCSLCTKVWGQGAMPQNSLNSALQRVRKALKEFEFPMYIKAVKSVKRKVVKGYALRKSIVH
jgi:DNA-binding winged helix-turn-helix (wHTH) protein